MSSDLTQPPEVGQRFSFRRLIFYIASAAVLLLIYFKFGEVEELKSGLLSSDRNLLLLAIGIQAGTYFFTALNYKLVLKIKGLNIGVKDMYPISFVILFLNQALPSAGISGQIFFIDYLKKKGLTFAEGVARVILELTTLYMAFGLQFVVTAFLAIQQEGHGHPELVYFIYPFLVIATIFLAIFILFQRETTGGWVHRFIDRFQNRANSSRQKNIGLFLSEMRENLSVESLRKVRGPFTLAILSQLAVLILDVLTVFVLAAAIDHPVSFGIVFIVFTLTQFASMISFVPGSLGVFEGGMTLLFVGFGLPSHAALTVTLLFRGLTFWLPMPIGWLLYRKYEKTLHLKA